MSTTIAGRIQALRQMTVAELRDEYRRVFGEEPRSHHRDNLWRRIAWRIQALEEGGLPERVLRRASEIANDADVRVLPPRDGFQGGSSDPSRTRVRQFSPTQDRRLPMPGTVLTREYRGRQLRVLVLDRGFEFEGKVYRSLTAIAEAVTGAHWNGFGFFGLAG